MLLSSGLQLLSLYRKCPTTTVYEPADNLRIDIQTRLQYVDAPADRQSGDRSTLVASCQMNSCTQMAHWALLEGSFSILTENDLLY